MADTQSKKPRATKPVTPKPVSQKPGSTKPVTPKPVSQKPAASKPAASKPAAKKPAAKKPAAKKPAAPPNDVARKPAVLPAALAKRAKALHAEKQARLKAKGRAAIARVHESQVDIAANMVDIGLALAELKEEGVAEALGRASFAEICELDLRMSISTANVLVNLATKVPREVVTRFGIDRARAALELVEATPENESITDLLRAKIALPSGRSLDVAKASTQEMRDAAKELRDARAGATEKRSRGLTTTPSEKKAFEALSKHLKGRGYEGLRLVAGRDGKGAKVRMEARLAEVGAFGAALQAASKG